MKVVKVQTHSRSGKVVISHNRKVRGSKPPIYRWDAKKLLPVEVLGDNLVQGPPQEDPQNPAYRYA